MPFINVVMICMGMLRVSERWQLRKPWLSMARQLLVIFNVVVCLQTMVRCEIPRDQFQTTLNLLRDNIFHYQHKLCNLQGRQNSNRYPI